MSEVCRWIEAAVIGLDLCPFAESAYRQRRIHTVVSESTQVDDLMLELYQEIQRLRKQSEIETTLLIISRQLKDFTDFNAMLDHADALIKAYQWTGEFQIASFHPHYQFANSQINDRENWSNRAPYPILHILRESSVEQAISHYPG
ncbi:MAG: DUF1415 domain-containing protein, partial [Gammaproteobacteria bacterium]|nr:DUF1415 domain-containing protein [Gammaproteobacteria bacterium]